jgi:hypothetical protein
MPVKGSTYCRRDDDREYIIVCVARARSRSGYWTEFMVVHKPTLGDYPEYVMSLEEFERDFYANQERP